jgi:hypothetical protein
MHYKNPFCLLQWLEDSDTSNVLPLLVAAVPSKAGLTLCWTSPPHGAIVAGDNQKQQGKY